MDIKKLNDKVSVAAQIALHDMADIAEAGFQVVMSNRPDGEQPGQPTFAQIKAAAQHHGMEAISVPVVSGRMQPDDPAKFGTVLDAFEGKVLAFCRTGTRSSILWALDQKARGTPREEILAVTQAAGYDLSGVV